MEANADANGLISGIDQLPLQVSGSLSDWFMHDCWGQRDCPQWRVVVKYFHFETSSSL